ncbi:hypothetical protein DXG01_001965 [Tephrocybe rancida]|nr:hypothetical protein DXG01_001965 [Tephrocybe rancida]
MDGSLPLALYDNVDDVESILGANESTSYRHSNSGNEQRLAIDGPGPSAVANGGYAGLMDNRCQVPPPSHVPYVQDTFPQTHPETYRNEQEPFGGHHVNGNRNPYVSRPHTVFGRDGYPTNDYAPAGGATQQQTSGHTSGDGQMAQVHAYYQRKLEDQRLHSVTQFRAAMAIGAAKYDEAMKEVQLRSVLNADLRSDLEHARRNADELTQDRARRMKEGETLWTEVKELRDAKDRTSLELRRLKDRNKWLKAETDQLAEQIRARDHAIEVLKAEGSVARSLAQNLYWEKKERARSACSTHQAPAMQVPSTHLEGPSAVVNPAISVEHPVSQNPFEPSQLSVELKLKQEEEGSNHTLFLLDQPSLPTFPDGHSLSPTQSYDDDVASDLDLFYPTDE